MVAETARGGRGGHITIRLIRCRSAREARRRHTNASDEMMVVTSRNNSIGGEMSFKVS